MRTWCKSRLGKGPRIPRSRRPGHLTLDFSPTPFLHIHIKISIGGREGGESSRSPSTAQNAQYQLDLTYSSWHVSLAEGKFSRIAYSREED
jgi:hypothetical protein